MKAWSAISATRACRNTATRKSTTPSRSPSRSPTAGSASPTNTGPRRCCPTPTRSCRRGSRPIWSAPCAPTRPTICRIRRPSRSAAPAAPMRGCSPAPRKPASSASTFRSAASAATTSSSGSTISICLIDWGWFYFITKPMFLALDFFYHLVGNFGIAILLVTVLVKLLFFPLANKSYASMAKMKSVQPQLAALKERYPDDKVKQQQEMMEIYKKEKINPIAGCLPVALADSGVLLALQGAVRHHRNAPRAVLRLDQGSVGARSDQPVQPVRPAAFRSDHSAAVRALPRARRLADHHGHHDVVPDEAQSDAAGSDPADDLRLDAADLHLHAGGLPGGPRDLLGLEQHAVGAAAELHHAPQRREGGTVRQSARRRSRKKAESKT